MMNLSVKECHKWNADKEIAKLSNVESFATVRR